MADLPNFENLSKEELIKLLNAVNNELNATNNKLNAVNNELNATNNKLNAVNNELNAANKKVVIAELNASKFEKKASKLEKKTIRLEKKNTLLEEKNLKLSHQLAVVTTLTSGQIKLTAEMTKEANCRLVVADRVLSLELSEQLREIFAEHIEWIQDAVKWRAQLFASGLDRNAASSKNNKVKDKEHNNDTPATSDIEGKSQTLQEQLAKAKETANRGIKEAVKNANSINELTRLAVQALPKECLTDELNACINIAKIKTPEVETNTPKKSPGKKAKQRKPNRTVHHTVSKSHICASCATKMNYSGDQHCKTLISKVGEITRCVEVLEMISDIAVCPQCGRVHICLEEKEDLPIKPNRSIGIKFMLHACDCICHGVPLNQLASAVQQNLEVGHSTIVDNLSDFTKIYLLPLYNRIIKKAQQAKYIMADGTPFNCLETQGRGNCMHKKDRAEDEENSTSNYILSFCSVPKAKIQFSCYDFLPTRSFSSIKEVLTDDFKFKTLISDAFLGYDSLASQHNALIQNCLVHLRRYIIEDLNPEQLSNELLAMPEKDAEKFISQSLLSDNNDRFLLLWVFYAFSKIYAYEGYAKEQNNDAAIINAREIESKLMTQIETIMSKMVERHLVPTKSGKKLQKKKGDPFSRATFYWYSHKENFKTYLNDPMVPPDTNMVEQSIRPLTILRKNSCFMNSERGIKDLCVIFSIWRTFRINGYDDPFAHLMQYCHALYSHCIDEGYTRAFRDNPDVLSKKINSWNMQELSKDFDFDSYLPF